MSGNPGHLGHPEPTSTPAPIYSEAPEAVFPTPSTHGPVSPHSDTLRTTSIPDAMHSYAPTPVNGPPEPQYPHTPDSIGQAPAYDASTSMATPPEKAYAGQPVPQYTQTAQPQQGAGPQQFYTPSGHPSGYATAVPLHAVQSAPCPVDCPVCGKREMTRTQAISGGTTHGWAAVLCFCCCLGCIPYLMSSLKDVEHACGQCGAKLATWHNSGRVDVLQNGARK
ncbi:LPS-induced tumor necrosis factor alpha factor [Penicillium griseofulvum]|uniref:LPS-induced tumor necrosis factor alpha factor n=1 Tax=Penicillium patulum TaxID=5078 RepID=A0A135LE06_PENPA|nr:LPS-induced tumor necrosis factor alpha factor [Penicillium griseofulvum]KXG47195.1 LPS-induced tumor necrosis factor alpha factor [Penicillium griseofulvum]